MIKIRFLLVTIRKSQRELILFTLAQLSEVNNVQRSCLNKFSRLLQMSSSMGGRGCDLSEQNSFVLFFDKSLLVTARRKYTSVDKKLGFYFL